MNLLSVKLSRNVRFGENQSIDFSTIILMYKK